MGAAGRLCLTPPNPTLRLRQERLFWWGVFANVARGPGPPAQRPRSQDVYGDPRKRAGLGVGGRRCTDSQLRVPPVPTSNRGGHQPGAPCLVEGRQEADLSERSACMSFIGF
jgi:hypothetical protein